ncbi:MAG: hypothetical protein V4663_15000 [Bacteroidota bacterium]
MKKFQLHQKGIKELQQLLYDLPDPKLAIEVLNLRTDFKKWVKSKFELTPDELDYLEQLNKHFIEYAAIKSSNFLAQRKPIHFSIVEFKPESIST